MAGEAIPPPYVITANDKRGLLVVTGAAVLAFVWCCFLIRAWLRFQTREWRSDDWALTTATLLDTAQSGFIFHLVNLGLGASPDDVSKSQLERVAKEGLGSQILYILVLIASKLSVLFLYTRLSPGGSHRIGTWSAIAACCVWALLSVILIAVPCNTIQAFDDPETCTNQWAKWQAIGALDITTEIVIFCIAVHLVWSLQMRLKSKILVTLAFSARLPVIAASAVRLYYLKQELFGNNNTFEYVVATQWQMGYAIMSSTITGMGPFLRPFTKEYTTSYRYGSNTQKSSQPDERSGGGSALRPRASFMSQSYLMETLPSRRASTRTLPDTVPRKNHSSSPSAATSIASDHGSCTPPSQVPVMLVADEHFRPADNYGRHETEVWVGDRSMSIGQGGVRSGMGGVSKKTEFKVEVDQASRAV